MIGLEKCCITSAYLQWLCHSGERAVARGLLVLPQLVNVMSFKPIQKTPNQHFYIYIQTLFLNFTGNLYDVYLIDHFLEINTFLNKTVYTIYSTPMITLKIQTLSHNRAVQCDDLFVADLYSGKIFVAISDVLARFIFVF